MRFLARFGLGLCGLALLISPLVKAQPPAPVSNEALPAGVQVAGHQHKGLFGWRHCVECQRAWAKKHDGVDVPPPPSYMPAGVVPGQVVHEHMQGSQCAACEAGAGETGPVTVVQSYPPGHAVVGGPTLAGNYAPGYAVVGGVPGVPGADPTPVGVSRTGLTQWNGPRMAAGGPRTGSGAAAFDPSVLPSSMLPAQTALADPSSKRPHVISHLLGFGGISRQVRESREDKRRQSHASISYDPAAQPIQELPASMVYDKGH